MTTRILPREEWPRLAGTELETIWPSLDPAFAEVLVVERDSAIIGSVALLRVLHAECLSMPSDVAGARAGWQFFRARVRAAGASAVWGAAIHPRMQRLLERHAAPVPGSHFLVRV